MREEAEASLMKELSGTFRPGTTKDHVVKLEAQLKPMFTAMPQAEDGTLTHSVVRYVLHRFFVQRGWYIRGLEPAAGTPSIRNRANDTLQGIHEWVPSFLQGFLEQLHGGRGISIRELAVLAATLEDLVHKESHYYLQEALSMTDTLYMKEFAGKSLSEVLQTYVLNFVQGRQTSKNGFTFSLARQDVLIHELGSTWPKIVSWLDSVRHQVAPKGVIINMKVLTHIIEAIGEQYHSFKDEECGHLKSDLLDIEAKKAGRVRLTEFYKRGIDKHSSPKYNEQLDYLRILGAIDESDPMDPHVIVPNYVASRPNCIAISGFYNICCKNECEDLMGKLEEEIKDEFAAPGQLLRMIASYSSDTVEGPRELSTALTQHLYGISKANHGVVPLHGRLFAQWMHHAFPRECPFPHENGKTNPQTPDEWLEETGRTDAMLSRDALAEHMDEHGATNDLHPIGHEARKHHHFDENELPWDDSEELLIPVNLLHPSVGGGARGQFRHTIRTIVVFVTLGVMAFQVKSMLFRLFDWESEYASKLV